MNRTKLLAKVVGFVFSTALLGVLAGSTTTGTEISVGVTIHSASDFYEPLTPHGDWVVVGSYGRCWRPTHVAAGWRPYCNGNWQQTDDGWYWVSDEPWGWATYHYGRWDFDAETGWFWVPQTVWAPAWVSWHEGGGYIGWAPLSPSGRVDERVDPTRVVFVEQRRFLEPIRPTTVVVNNTTIINKTVVNQGPQAAAIEKATGHRIQPVQVSELRRKEEVAVAAKPRITAPATEKQVQPPVRTVTEPTEKQVAPAREPRSSEKTVVPPTVSESPTPKPGGQNLNEPKPAPQVRPTEDNRGRKEVTPEPKREVKPEVAMPTPPKARPEPKPEVKPEPKPESKPEAKPEPEKHNQNPEKPDKGSEKKGNE